MGLTTRTVITLSHLNEKTDLGFGRNKEDKMKTTMI